MTDMVRRPALREQADRVHALISREWLVTNGRGGYASGTIAGIATRRYHGPLIAALPAPLGRTVMLNHLWEEIRLPDGTHIELGGRERSSAFEMVDPNILEAFELQLGLPVWRYRVNGFRLEKRLLMPYQQNTVFVRYTLLEGAGTLRIRVHPSMHFRSHEAPVSTELYEPYSMTVIDQRYELAGDPHVPPLRMRAYGNETRLVYEPTITTELIYRVEAARGYESRGKLWSPGYFHCALDGGDHMTLAASVEEWDVIEALEPAAAWNAEHERREALLALAAPASTRPVAAELTLAADQFIITPSGRAEDAARASAAGEELRTVIAGYHWFTDWGRDTMISLEGLTLCTNRRREAGYVLRTFAHYVHAGLIPNMFPDHATRGLYHTADATLWFFHAIDRYLAYTEDAQLLADLLPVMRRIIEQHVQGTLFGIGVDSSDGLLRQGEEGYQLTWMDAKVDGWVVTPRRGKAVEINALWYNALRLTEGWTRELHGDGEARAYQQLADRAYKSFNERFWIEDAKYLYDVVDGENGDDPACRPNQVFAISLPHPVLQPDRWAAVMAVVTDKLLTPVGLRSLSPDHPDYKAQYFGDLYARDAAYHQGTVWAWLIGPYIDAHLALHPDDRSGARALLDGLVAHLDDFGVGSIAEVFDAEAPYTPRGCIAQAWSVAEVLRCLVKVNAA